MAGKYDEYEKILYGSKASKKSALSKAQNTANTYKARLAAGGADPEQAIDKRNFLEKALNLKQDQNVIFDLFELLNRPQQALFGGIESLQKGRDFLEGAGKGITGDKETAFKDILMNTGDFSDREGKLDLVDALGFAGDVFLDPADLVPVAGFDKANDILKAGGSLRDAYKATDSLTDVAFKGVGKAIKGTAKGADNLIEKGLTKLDAAKGVKAYDKFGNVISDGAKIVYGNLDDAKRASDLIPIIKNQDELGSLLAKTDKGRLQSYKQLKDSIVDIFKKSKPSVDAILSKRAADNTANEIKLKIGNTLKQNEDIVKKFITESGGDINDAAKLNEVGEDISLFLESMMDRSIEKDELLDLIREGKVSKNAEIEKALNEMQNQVVNEISKVSKMSPEDVKKSFDFSFKTNDKGIIQLTGNGWNKNVLRENGITSFKDLDEASSLIKDYGNWYTDTDLERIEELKKNKGFREMINEMFGEIKDTDKIVIDPLSDSIKILPYPQSEDLWRKQNREMIEHFKKQGLSEDEILKNIEGGHGNYEGAGYTMTGNSWNINDKIRQGKDLGADEATVRDLDNYIGDFKSTEDIGLLRKDTSNTMKKVYGLPEDLSLEQTMEALKSRIGEPVKFNDAFTSTAVGEGWNYASYKDATMRIKAPSGTNMFVTNEAEREAILKRGQQMILRDVSIGTNKYGDPELLLNFDLYDGGGRYLATIDNNKTANNLNKIIDEGFGTNFSRFNEGNMSNVWLPHTLADNTMADVAKDTGVPILRGNTSLVSHRTRLGSLRENNNLYKQALGDTDFFKKYPKLFEENFNKALANKYYDDNGLIGLAKQHKVVNDTLIGQTFASRSEIENLQKLIKEKTLSGDKTELKKLTNQYNKLIENSNIKYLTDIDKEIPNGFTKLTADQTNDIKNKLIKMRQAVGADSEGYNKLIKLFDESKGNVAINDDVLRMLQVTIDPKQKNALLNAYDKVLNLYKSTKTLSFTNNINNFVGNSSNLYLSGISPMDQARLMPQAVEVANKGQDLYIKKLSGEVLNAKENKIADIWKDFLDTGFGSEEIALDLQDLPDFMKDLAKNGSTTKKITPKDVATALPRLNMRANTYVDNLNRITVMLKAKESPAYLKKLGIDGANDIEKYRKAISKVMFDPSMMTEAEKNVVKRIIPFYTYTKNNLIFQLDNLGRNGSRYNRLVKTIKGLQKSATGDNEENLADYIKNNLYIPIPGIDKDGNYTVLRSQLPFGDVIELTDNPMEYLVNKSGPIIKSPVEFATNKNSFSGLDIEKFPGEKSNNIPFLTKKQEKLIGDLTGLDVPLKTGSRLFSGDPLSSIAFRSNINTDQLNKTYQQIDDLKNLMKQYEQKGYQFSTISELKKANKNNEVESINALFAKYGIDTNSNKRNKSPYEELEELLRNR